jgi:hypothetical protein
MRGFNSFRFDTCVEIPVHVFDQMHPLEQIESRRFAASGGIDEDVEIAVGPSIATGTRTEDGEFGQALGFDRGSNLAQLRDNGLRRDVSNVIHGSILAQLSPRGLYSAASLWPSLALSLWINSSAASAITVPGGKIASAPALYRAS